MRCRTRSVHNKVKQKTVPPHPSFASQNPPFPQREGFFDSFTGCSASNVISQFGALFMGEPVIAPYNGSANHQLNLTGSFDLYTM